MHALSHACTAPDPKQSIETIDVTVKQADFNPFWAVSAGSRANGKLTDPGTHPAEIYPAPNISAHHRYPLTEGF
ncbi:hypothetical protein EVAR_75512_1 [Eumeta japonica]|uniref:Uncharacterized protein n=1 Tax=Eumeta variegata TaxID=151549 RepID=A0A4C1UJN2_EUMVA|nr:hypothetical protein EVAR_75512_1 [Eumeta japonica]